MMTVVTYGIATIFGVLVVGWVIIMVIRDVTQKQHTILRNYPLVGRLRFYFENLGDHLGFLVNVRYLVAALH